MRVQRPSAPRSIPTTTSASTSGSGPVIRRTTNEHDEPPSAGSWAFNPELRAFTGDSAQSKESGFLIRKHTYNSAAHKSKDAEFEAPSTIAFDKELLESDQAFSSKDEIYQLTDTRVSRDSTITPSERHAFQKIFSDIFQRYDRSNSGSAAAPIQDDVLAEIDGMTGANDLVNVHRGDSRSAQSKLASIFGGAISMTREKKEETVNRYPIALRPAAARAIGLDMEQAMEAEAKMEIQRKENDAENERMEALREPERARVEGLMKAAKTDFELWEIMEKEVFSLISKMGLEDLPAAEENSPRKKRKGRKSRKDEPKQNPEEKKKVAPMEETTRVSPLSLYGPLYPSYILLGLRLLDRSFARPSPLALSLLPKIKSMGFISHVLGASTQFYNELIRIYRYRHDDFTGISNLLTEMENAALDMDDETFEVVFDIVQTQLSVERGEKGREIMALWHLPEFAPHKFKGWRLKIEQAISEKKLRAAAYQSNQFFV